MHGPDDDEPDPEGLDDALGPPHPSQRRRHPPPDATGAEAEYLFGHKEARTPMVVSLLDGQEVRGVIEYYDKDMIKVNRTDGPNLFIRKSHIRYMHRDPGGWPPSRG